MNLLAAIRAVIEELRQHNIVVGAIATDNASNMKGAALLSGAFDVRCACHGLQLIAKHLEHEDFAKNAIEVVRKLRQDCGDSPALKRVQTARDQRWLDHIREWKQILGVNQKFIELTQARDAGVEEAEAQLRAFSTYRQLRTTAAPRAPSEILVLRTAIERMTPLLVATRMCEGDASDQFDVISALGAIGFENEGLGGSFGKEANASVLSVVSNHLIYPALVITAFFCPCRRDLHELGNENRHHLERAIRSWFESKVVREMISHFEGTSHAMVTSELSVFLSAVFVPERPERLTRESFKQFLLDSAESKRYAKLFHVVRLISLRLASEASAERAFKAMRLTYTDQRASMWPETVAASTQVLTFAKKEARDFIARRRRNARLPLMPETRKQQTMMRSSNRR